MLALTALPSHRFLALISILCSQGVCCHRAAKLMRQHISQRYALPFQTVMRLVDAVVKRTNADVSDAANVLQDILASAANVRGEWELPLSEENTAAMRRALEDRSQHLNEVNGV